MELDCHESNVASHCVSLEVLLCPWTLKRRTLSENSHADRQRHLWLPQSGLSSAVTGCRLLSENSSTCQQNYLEFKWDGNKADRNQPCGLTATYSFLYSTRKTSVSWWVSPFPALHCLFPEPLLTLLVFCSDKVPVVVKQEILQIIK